MWSYWINVVLISIPFILLLRIIEVSNMVDTNPLLAIQMTMILVAISMPLGIWQIGGCWRSARNHIQATGRLFWARVVQIIMVLAALNGMGELMKSAPGLVEYAKIATRTEQFTEYTVNVIADG